VRLCKSAESCAACSQACNLRRSIRNNTSGLQTVRRDSATCVQAKLQEGHGLCVWADFLRNGIGVSLPQSHHGSWAAASIGTTAPLRQDSRTADIPGSRKRTFWCRNSCCCSTGTPNFAATAFLMSSTVCSYFTLLAVRGMCCSSRKVSYGLFHTAAVSIVLTSHHTCVAGTPSHGAMSRISGCQHLPPSDRAQLHQTAVTLLMEKVTVGEGYGQPCHAIGAPILVVAVTPHYFCGILRMQLDMPIRSCSIQRVVHLLMW
jgi:hypothetical protein